MHVFNLDSNSFSSISSSSRLTSQMLIIDGPWRARDYSGLFVALVSIASSPISLPRDVVVLFWFVMLLLYML